MFLLGLIAMKHFLATDSMGKTSSKERPYCYAVCESTNADVCVYAPGASIVKLMSDVGKCDLINYRSGTIVSMMNGLGIPFNTWQGLRLHYVSEFDAFAQKMHLYKIDTALWYSGVARRCGLTTRIWLMTTA